jgi:endonuclease/exonuclease/phosphatase family protein
LARKSDDKITLMTRNLYQGVDLSPLATATNPTEFFKAVGAAYNRMQATNFLERAKVLAGEIVRASPDLIGLQEAVLFRTQIPADGPTTPATNVSYDFIQILVDALKDRGVHYTTAVVQTGFDIEAPGSFATGPMDVRLTDRDAILVRENIKDFGLSNAQGAQFAAKSSFPSPFGSVNFPCSWVSVDVTFRGGNKVRIISTHLEPISPSIQISQATELLNGPGNTRLPSILIGDFNSNADGTGTQTYPNLINAGFKDAWTLRGQGNGSTCCQRADLLNPESTLNRRIDLALFRGDVKVQSVQLTGNTTKERTPSNHWPSDHAGLVTKLKLTVPKN